MNTKPLILRQVLLILVSFPVGLGLAALVDRECPECFPVLIEHPVQAMLGGIVIGAMFGFVGGVTKLVFGVLNRPDEG